MNALDIWSVLSWLSHVSLFGFSVYVFTRTQKLEEDYAHYSVALLDLQRNHEEHEETVTKDMNSLKRSIGMRKAP